MGLFWKRKSKDQFVTLGLNEPKTEAPAAREVPNVAADLEASPVSETVPAANQTTAPVVAQPVQNDRATSATTFPPAAPAKQKPSPVPSPFATSVLGLNLSIEELQAQE